MTATDDTESETSSTYLIWEDAENETWWLSRSHDDEAAYIIAPDSITKHLLVLRQPTGSRRFKVIATVHSNQANGLSGAIAEAKRDAIKWIGDPKFAPIKSSVRAWRAQRWTKIALREVPLALISSLIGCVLAFFVAAFFIMTEVTGWPMVLVGTLLGLSSGWLLKWAADRKFTSLMGPFGRFVTVTGSATLGAFLTVSVFFVLFPG
ncbi:MAG: hypothetical protein HOH20_14330 [Rhodospirillaceae bacterium]|jgi:hypothetical protein|nr:hypothetical protein [Rhodospirillaceae bacterium]MBT5240436.1 hypothetical protein [Rhodospirillaceae bacterium]MBT5566696.1 hypothetical protein [Rhodospirillaceae bacterium]MBT6090747.1 hypothetical protein [Rhodospirillaceae bacterium]MBT6959866.1 hypothetical protein [Rhodospirillaceae bacterium]